MIHALVIAADPAVLFQPNLLDILTFVVAFLMPLLVGLITTRTTNAGVKAVLLAAAAAVLSIANAWITAIQTDKPFDLWAAVLTFGGAFIVAVAGHFGLWKPTGLATAAQDIAFSSGKHIDAGTAVKNTPAVITTVTTTSKTPSGAPDPAELLATTPKGDDQ